MHIDDLSVSDENDIRLARELLLVKPISIT
jgi:hypothetical protein